MNILMAKQKQSSILHPSLSSQFPTGNEGLILMRLSQETFIYLLIYLFLNYLLERECAAHRMPMHTGGRYREREYQADFPLSTESNWGLNATTPRL